MESPISSDDTKPKQINKTMESPISDPKAKQVLSDYLCSDDDYECSDNEYHDQQFAQQNQLRSSTESCNGIDMSLLPKEYFSTFFTAGEKPDSLIRNLNHLSKLAIEKYNQENEKNYQLLKYVKAIYSLLQGFVYYIMFEAQQPSDNSPATFTTFVNEGIPFDGEDGIEFEFVYMVSCPNKEGNSCCGN